MARIYYLASHDYITAPEPRAFQLVGAVIGTNGRKYHVIDVSPPIPKEVISAVADTTRLLLAFCRDKDTFESVGLRDVIVDVYFVPPPVGRTIDPTKLLKLGNGTLHADIAVARKHSPVDS